ncbi:YkgJ family cysteine cluster protein [Persephonella sp.]
MEELKQLVIASAYLLRGPELVDQIIEYQKEINREVDKAVSRQKGLACEKGCSHCCYGWLVKLSVAEALYMTQQLNSLPEKTRKKLAEKLEKYAGLKSHENQPCPMLENSLCVVYNARPYICRTYSSYSKTLCQLNKKIEFPPFIQEITENIKKPMEQQVEEPFDILFDIRTPITQIKYDRYKNAFYINLANTVQIYPFPEKTDILPLEYAKKYMNL